jgi:succinoglycan biosynthesis transport protein ExoP
MNNPQDIKTDGPIRQESGADATEWDVGNGSSTTKDPGGSHVAGAYLPLAEDEYSQLEKPLNLDLRRFIIGAWQRRYLGIVTATGIMLLLLALITFGISRHWQTSVTLIKRSHQDRLSLAERDPFKIQDYSLATLLDTLKLSSSLDTVRKKAGLNVSLTALAAAIDISIGRDSKIINLKMTWDDPELAADLANLMAETFVDRTRLLLHKDAQSAYDYYSDQLLRSREDARVVSSEVMAFRQTNGISNLDAETKVLLEEMSRLQSELNSRRAEVGALNAATIRLESAISDEPEEVITFTIYRSPLKTRLSEYDWELQDALSKYTDQNPKVIKLKQRIDALNQMIKANNDEAVPENTYTRNTKREEMELRLQQLVDEIQLKEAQGNALEDTLLGMNSKVAMLSSKEKEYLMLQSRLEGILTLENELNRRVQETRLVMQRNDASFDIVEKAVVPPAPLPSGRKLLGAASLVLALGGGLVLILLLEWIDPVVRSLRDVKDIVGDSNFLEVSSDSAESGKMIDSSLPITELSSLFRRLCNDMDVSGARDSTLPLAVVSLDRRSGRSSVTANMALTRVMKGQNVLLIDADLRKDAGPRPAERLGLNVGEPGLYEHMREGNALVPEKHFSGKLSYVAATSGQISDDSGLLELASRDLSRVMLQLRPVDFTLVDIPPLKDLEVAMELTGQIGRALLVIRSGESRRDELRRCMEQLEKRGIECVGAILLDVPTERLETAPIIKLPEFDRVFGSRRVTANV